MHPNATMSCGFEAADILGFLMITLALITAMMDPFFFNNVLFRKPRAKVVVQDVVSKVEEVIEAVEEAQVFNLYEIVQLSQSEEQVRTFTTTVEVDDLPLEIVPSLELASSSEEHIDSICTPSPPPSKRPRQRLTSPPSDRVLRSQVPRSISLPAPSKSTSPSPSPASTDTTKKRNVRARSAPQQPAPKTGLAAGSASSKRSSSKKAKA